MDFFKIIYVFIATFFSHLVLAEEYFTVFFESNGGSEVPSQEVMFNRALDAPKNPIKKGFGFSGWYKDSNFLLESLFNLATPIVEDTKLYAKWGSLIRIDKSSGAILGMVDDYNNQKDLFLEIPKELYGVNVLSIVEGAFQDINNIGWVEFNAPIHIVPSMSFKSCKSLYIVSLNSPITNIGEEAFYGCEKLTKILLPLELKKIKKKAFYGCKKLDYILIPEQVNHIEDSAFSGCSNLTVFMMPKTPPFLGSDNAFVDGDIMAREILVPKESIDAYKKADGWSFYKEIIKPY